MNAEKVCLIIPCYNEEKRLDFNKFKEFIGSCYFIFVNDGSTDNTLAVLENNRLDGMYVLNLQKNGGKAEAVRQGMLYSKTLPVYDKIEWVGFWDADLSTPLCELENFLFYHKNYAHTAVSIWGSRVRRLGSNIDRTYKRHILGRLFANVSSFFLNLKCYDSQCGAKLFSKSTIDKAFSESFLSRWIFDVEILLRLRNAEIVECPLLEWQDVKGSKIKMLPVAYRTLAEILALRKKYLKN